MTRTYNYDETGGPFSLFLFIFITMFTIGYGIYVYQMGEVNPPEKNQEHLSCECDKCKKYQQKKKSEIGWVVDSKKVIFLSLIGLVLATLINAWVMRFSYVKNSYDPYAILDVSREIDEASLKRAYRKLSRMYHPDTVPADKRKDAEDKFIEITKAYKTLTDPVIKANYEATGNPDGVDLNSIGIAIPQWLISSSNRSKLLILYLILVLIFLPMLIWKKWYIMKIYTKYGTMYSSYDIFFLTMSSKMTRNKLISLLAKANEFKVYPAPHKPEVLDLTHRIEAAYEAIYSNYPPPLMDLSLDEEYTYLALHAHLLRLPPIEKRPNVLSIIKPLLFGVQAIAIEKEDNSVVELSVVLYRMFVQAYPSIDMESLQVPGLTSTLAVKISRRTKTVPFPQFVQMSKESQITALMLQNNSSLSITLPYRLPRVACVHHYFNLSPIDGGYKIIFFFYLGLRDTLYHSKSPKPLSSDLHKLPKQQSTTDPYGAQDITKSNLTYSDDIKSNKKVNLEKFNLYSLSPDSNPPFYVHAPYSSKHEVLIWLPKITIKKNHPKPPLTKYLSTIISLPFLNPSNNNPYILNESILLSDITNINSINLDLLCMSLSGCDLSESFKYNPSM